MEWRVYDRKNGRKEWEPKYGSRKTKLPGVRTRHNQQKSCWDNIGDRLGYAGNKILDAWIDAPFMGKVVICVGIGGIGAAEIYSGGTINLLLW